MPSMAAWTSSLPAETPRAAYLASLTVYSPGL
jgi:hypothetical protein